MDEEVKKLISDLENKISGLEKGIEGLINKKKQKKNNQKKNKKKFWRTFNIWQKKI